jgi:toxin ParE1/3/4
MTVFWTDAALADLRLIEAQIGRHSPNYARGMIAKIFGRAGDLVDFPHLGPVVSEYVHADLRELFEDPYRILYRIVDPQRLDIVAVVHGARRLPRGL